MSNCQIIIDYRSFSIKYDYKIQLNSRDSPLINCKNLHSRKIVPIKFENAIKRIFGASVDGRAVIFYQHVKRGMNGVSVRLRYRTSSLCNTVSAERVSLQR